jgi:predicted ATPase
MDAKVVCLCYAAWALWALGYPDQALQKSHEALTQAQELSHPLSLVVALSYTALLHQFLRQRQAAQERSEAVIALSTEQEFPHWLALGTLLRGWALAAQGEVGEGLTQIRQGLTAYRVTGAQAHVPKCLSLLAEAYGKGGQVEEGLTVLAEALAMANKNGERVWEAEIYRLKGELTLQQFKVQGAKLKEAAAEAEECFLKAIEVARKQQAKSLELRATVSLARLWQQQGKKKQARKMLAEIYTWFTEGFDTKDLQEARGLLEELTQ